MRYSPYALVLFLIAILIVGCAPAPAGPSADVPSSPSEVADLPPPPSVEDVDSLPLEEVAPQNKPNPEIESLIAKSSQIKSFSFDAAVLPSKVTFATYKVRGSKVKIKLITPVLMNGWSADHVYLDYDKKIANGYCIELANCKKDGKVGPLDFSTYAIKLPLDWTDAVSRGVKAKALTFESRPATVVTWQAGGHYFEAYIDNYYGVPMRVSETTDLEMTNVVGGNEYRSIAFNNVKEEDVTPPW